MVDSGLDETSCFFIDEDGQEIPHGYYFEEMAFLEEGTYFISTGGNSTYDLSRRKVGAEPSARPPLLLHPIYAISLGPYNSWKSFTESLRVISIMLCS